MPKEFEDMVSAIKKSLKQNNPKMKDKDATSRAFAIATDRWKKSHGGKAPGREELKDWRVLEFYTPIEENFSEGDDFIIRGVAINETTTLNNVKYVAEELEKAAPSFRNVPILLDHKNEIKSIVGRTTERVDWNPNFRRVDFEAKIMDKEIVEMIKDGRIGSVSIGAKVQDLIEEEDGSMKAIGIYGLEISLVAVPGDSDANLAQAMQRGLTLKEIASDDYKFKKEDKMAEEEKTEEVPEVVKPAEESKEVEEPKEVEKPKVAEEKAQKINVKVDTTEISGMKEQIAELKELLMEKKKIQEQVDEEKEKESEEEKPKDETKGEVSTEAEEKLDNVNNLIVEAVGRDKFSMYKDYSRESTDTNLKRLVR